MTIDELKELDAKATPPGWLVVKYGDGDSLVICQDALGEKRISFMATPGCRDSVDRKRTWQRIKADAALIVALRNNVETFLRWREERDAMRVVVERIVTLGDTFRFESDEDIFRFIDDTQNIARAELERIADE